MTIKTGLQKISRDIIYRRGRKMASIMRAQKRINFLERNVKQMKSKNQSILSDIVN